MSASRYQVSLSIALAAQSEQSRRQSWPLQCQAVAPLPDTHAAAHDEYGADAEGDSGTTCECNGRKCRAGTGFGEAAQQVDLCIAHRFGRQRQTVILCLCLAESAEGCRPRLAHAQAVAQRTTSCAQ
ncbi:hypothetical protein GCM10010308_70590 [Streptomyces vinaceusdrappus]|nr:hypothetical protein GCM10010308_70590 [Streptomyces vinaceusdrappus]